MKLLALLFLLVNPLLINAAPKAVYDSFWDKSSETNTTTIDHQDFDRFLAKYAKVQDGITKIPYGKVTDADKELLKNYVKVLESLPILSYSKEEQQAYWINLYNALTVKVILDTYPVKSIKESYGGAFKTGPWNKKFLKIEGKEVSLNDIEHRILRPLWKDSRVHFLVNCASIGCPNLMLKAITAKTYEDVADEAVKDFINSSRAVVLDENRLILTSLVDWYKDDFGTSIEDVIDYFIKYGDTQTKSKIQEYKEKRITYEYNWDLNVLK